MKQRWISSMKHTGLIRLVDDDAAIPQFPCAVLVNAGYKVRATKDTNEELHAFRTTADLPDLLITDVMKPGMRGPEPIRAMPGTGAISHAFLISGDLGAVNLDLAEPQVDIPVRLLKNPRLPAELLRMVARVLSPRPADRGTTPFTGADQISSFSRPPEFQD
jgi:CheY-like chemotaxis protein